MKIGIIIGSLGFGGAERVTLRLAEWFIKNNDEVSIYTTMAPPKEEYKCPNGVNRVYCHCKNSLQMVKKLREEVSKDKPDSIIIMDTPMCVFAVPAILGLKIPFLVSERSNPKNTGIKKTTKFLSHMLMRFASAFVFQTTCAMNCYGRGIRKKGVVIPNPLVLSELPEIYDGKRTNRIVAVGRLIKAKNYPLLINAFNEFCEKQKNYVLEIYGSGVEKENIEKLINSLPIKDKITLMGTHSDVLEKIRTARLYVLSSDFEGMPNALVEALALGIPSISTDCPSGGPADLIENGKNGFLVPVGDEDKMAEAMEKLVSDDALCDKMSKASVDIRLRLDIEVIGEKWKNLLEKISK